MKCKDCPFYLSGFRYDGEGKIVETPGICLGFLEPQTGKEKKGVPCERDPPRPSPTPRGNQRNRRRKHDARINPA